jgi:hypothetical protein
MPKTPIDYSKTIFFKADKDDEVLVSYTTNFTQSKYNYKKKGYDNFVPLEQFEAKDLMSVKIRLNHWNEQFGKKPTLELFADDKPITQKSHMSRLKNLAGGDVTDLEFLKDYETVYADILTNENPHTRINLLGTCCKVMNGSDHESYDFYKSKLFELKEKQKFLPRTEKQIENWLTKEQVMTVFNGLKNDTKHLFKQKEWDANELLLFQSFVVLSLFVLHHPRRATDYNLMKIGKGGLDSNWFMKKDKKFVFNVFKTSKTAGTQEIDVHADLLKTLTKYLQHHPNKKEKEYFLIYEGDASAILRHLFGKRVGTTMLRNIMLSNEYSEKVKEAKELYDEIEDVAKKMGTSLNTALEVYIKPDV